MNEKQKTLKDIKKYKLQQPDNFKKYIDKMIKNIRKDKLKKCKK